MSRENILRKIKANKPSPAPPLPLVPEFQDVEANLVELFKQSLENNKAQAMEATGSADVNDLVKRLHPTAEKIVSSVSEVKGTIENVTTLTLDELNSLDVAVIKGELGVADTGAIWVSDKTLPIRALPFITQYLVIVINASDLVHKMHRAYAQLHPLETGYGVFISGPSKTGDIEQALVIGAQGPFGLTVIIKS